MHKSLATADTLSFLPAHQYLGKVKVGGSWVLMMSESGDIVIEVLGDPESNERIDVISDSSSLKSYVHQKSQVASGRNVRELFYFYGYFIYSASNLKSGFF